MIKLSDLELITAKAKIEGLKTEIAGWNEDLLLNVSHRSQCKEYNPLTDKALLFDLMVKYDTSLCRHHDFVYIESDYTDRDHKASVSFSSKEELPRAILEYIVEANNNG